jgi:hypothetical protein
MTASASRQDGSGRHLLRSRGGVAQLVGRLSRQPIGEIGGKGGGKDDQVGYDPCKKVKGRKIHAVVDTEGLPMRVIVHSVRSRTATAPGWCSTRYGGASHGSN